MGFDAVSIGQHAPMFQKIAVPSCSGSSRITIVWFRRRAHCSLSNIGSYTQNYHFLKVAKKARCVAFSDKSSTILCGDTSSVSQRGDISRAALCGDTSRVLLFGDTCSVPQRADISRASLCFDISRVPLCGDISRFPQRSDTSRVPPCRHISRPATNLLS